MKNFKSLSFKFILNNLARFSPVIATKLLHYRVTGEILELDNPKLFNDKLQWLKLYYQNDLIVQCSDKYEVYNYLKEEGYEELLNELFLVVDDFDDIDFQKLPNKFALKCTHGCEYNICTKDKDALDLKEVKNKISKWKKENFSLKSLEFHYAKIKPRIIVEKFIENSLGELPLDYKIYCFNGEPKLVLVCSEREKHLRLDFFDLNWNRLHIGHPEDQSKYNIVKPPCFDKMVEYARKLSTPFPFVRIDFYDNDGTPIFGEFTFTPAANMANYYNKEGLKVLGDMLKLPGKSINE